MGLHSQRVGGVDQDTGVLWSDNRFDDGGQIIDVRERLDTQQDVVKSPFSARSILRRPYD